MRTTYQYLGYAIAAMVAFQASVMVFAIAGLYAWIQDGNALTETVMNSEAPAGFTGEVGFMLHFFGAMVVVLLALVLLVVSFFAKVHRGVAWAGLVLLAAVTQFTLGILGHSTPYAGMMHGVNALVLFTLALLAGRRATLREDVTRVREVAVSR